MPCVHVYGSVQCVHMFAATKDRMRLKKSFRFLVIDRLQYRDTLYTWENKKCRRAGLRRRARRPETGDLLSWLDLKVYLSTEAQFYRLEIDTRPVSKPWNLAWQNGGWLLLLCMAMKLNCSIRAVCLKRRIGLRINSRSIIKRTFDRHVAVFAFIKEFRKYLTLRISCMSENLNPQNQTYLTGKLSLKYVSQNWLYKNQLVQPNTAVTNWRLTSILLLRLFFSLRTPSAALAH